MAANPYNATYRQNLRKRAFDLIGNACVFCRSTDDVQAAHVLPTKLKGAGRGLDRRYLDIIKHPRSYAPMCVPCHRTFDRFVRAIKVTVVVEEPIPF